MPVIQIRSRGTITLPAQLRRKYNWEKGKALTAIDFGDGMLLLTSRPSRVMKSADQIVRKMPDAEINLTEWLEVLDEERQNYYQQHYRRDNASAPA